MLLISAVLEFASESDRDRAIELTAPIQKATRDDEEGCVTYCFAPDPCHPTKIQVFEEWDNGAALAAHFKHPNYDAMVEALGSVGIVDTTNKLYLVAKTEPVYGPNAERREVFFDGAEEPVVN